ncbi:uracil-DNA glycosylase [Aestuariispira insulae]|uniref:Uracil-DNA glycosylase n=1 Tax=Aestuariispira insulae TaxID=1461337 RepID=A0A3D9HMW9_9PROT|nr:uracil-DNA glycosylase [Aestuariispira insulae]RED50745.1 uracil-DNA glycosylase [Aestuariispira insulae]
MTWQNTLPFFKDGRCDTVMARVRAEVEAGKEVLPAWDKIFRAYDEMTPEEVKVVILGQDPYPTPGHAHGLSFSVEANVRPLPRSLNNIFKELETDLGIARPEHGNLEHWARQGVMLLNSSLTVEAGNAGSHAKYGWMELTDETISHLSGQCEHVVFILWGGHARKKKDLIDLSNHLIIESAHPSPLSASRGFFGSRPFSRANQYLKAQGRNPIRWG